MAQNSILSDFFKKHRNPHILKSKEYASYPPSSLVQTGSTLLLEIAEYTKQLLKK